MTTRAISSEDAAVAAEFVRQVRARPNDLIDPWPPSSELEMLVDVGARGKGQPCHPVVAVENDIVVVGYGAIDFSEEMRTAQLVGPVVHPAHRKRGHGRAIVEDLIERARRAGQKYLKAAVGAENGAGRALLKECGFKKGATHTCLRLARPEKLAPLPVAGIELRRVEPEEADDYYEFTKNKVPRLERQMRNLLKADNYVAIFAYKDGTPVACVEVDLRFGPTASVENLDAPPSLLGQGLGNALLMEAARHAFQNERVEALDILMAGTDRQRLEGLAASGFTVMHELQTYEARL